MYSNNMILVIACLVSFQEKETIPDKEKKIEKEKNPIPEKEKDPKVEKEEIEKLLKFKDKDLVEVLLKNGRTFKGVVVEHNSMFITLDMTPANYGLNGTMAIALILIKVIKKIHKIDDKTLAEILKKRIKIKDAIKQAEILRLKEREDEEKAREEVRKKKEKEKEKAKQAEKEENLADEIAKLNEGFALLKEFKPEEGWGDIRLAEIHNKQAILRVDLSPSEKKFVQNYDLWKKAKEYKEKKLQEPKEPPEF